MAKKKIICDTDVMNEITLKAFQLLQTFYLSHRLALPDCFIAATAIITRFELFSYNTKDYKFIPQIALFML